MSLSFYGGGVKRYSRTEKHIIYLYLQSYETSHWSITMANGNARRAQTMKCTFIFLRWADQFCVPTGVGWPSERNNV